MGWSDRFQALQKKQKEELMGSEIAETLADWKQHTDEELRAKYCLTCFKEKMPAESGQEPLKGRCEGHETGLNL